MGNPAKPTRYGAVSYALHTPIPSGVRLPTNTNIQGCPPKTHHAPALPINGRIDLAGACATGLMSLITVAPS
jgi:hypothetical protein